MEKTVNELAQLFGGKVVGDGSVKISGVSSAESVTPQSVTFAENEKYLKVAESKKAGAIVVPASIESSSRTLIQVPNPRVAFALSLEIFFPREKQAPGIHPTAVISEEAEISDKASIGPYAVIEKGVQIADGVEVGANCYIGKDSRIGENTLLYPRVVLYHQTKVGKNVILHSGVILGGDGFGYADEKEKRIKILQIGNVVIEDDVEIGCNSCVDRGTIGSTIIKKGTKIDNLVQVAHNDVVGENVLLCAQVGISGSSVIGNNVILAGQVGVADHVEIGEGAILGAQAGVPDKKKVPPKVIYGGTPARPLQEWKEQVAFSRRGGKMIKKLDEKIASLEAKISELETRLKESEISKI